MIIVPFLTPDPIDVNSLEQRARSEEPGAVVTFQGVVRGDRTPEGLIDHLLYEADEAAALKEFAAILREIPAHWPGAAGAVQHRLGRVRAGETSLFIAVSAPKRSAAFQACRFAADQIKTRVPIWKNDVYADATARRTVLPHQTILLSDAAIIIQES